MFGNPLNNPLSPSLQATGGAGMIAVTAGGLTGGTITINGRSYTFDAPGGGDVGLGAAGGGDPVNDATAIAAGINGDGDAVVTAIHLGPGYQSLVIIAKEVGVATNYTLTTDGGGAPGIIVVSGANLTGGAGAVEKQTIIISHTITAVEAGGHDGGGDKGMIGFKTGLTNVDHVFCMRRRSAGVISADNDDTLVVSSGRVYLIKGGDGWAANDIVTFLVIGS